MKSLMDTPVVLLVGARQTGKTTLARSLAGDREDAKYVSLDDLTTQGAAMTDPVGFIAGAETLTVIDEAHKAPRLFAAIKAAVDRDRRPGRFLLTGSTNVLFVPHVSDSLAGRMEIVRLAPFSQGEIEGVREGFIDAVFAEELSSATASAVRHDEEAMLWQRILMGGYPEVITRRDEERRHAWFASYLTTILQKDVRDLADVKGLTDMPRLLSILAARTSGLFNAAEVGREAGIPYATLQRYLALLEAVYLWQPLPAWSANLGKRLVRAPKAHLGDSGLTAHLTGAVEAGLAPQATWRGRLLEDFVVAELGRQAEWARTRVRLWHYHDTRRREADVILEDAAGRIVAIEVKAGATIDARDLASFRSLADDLGSRLRAAIVLYTGSETVPFGPRMFAMPVDALWHTGAVSNERERLARI